MVAAGDFDEKLANCSSANSLRTEASVAAVLRKLKWLPEQGAYYSDPTTGKLREIDVAARQFWRRSTSGGERTSTIQLVIECKTMKGWHVLFQPTRPLRRSDHRYEHWLGWDVDFHPDQVITALSGIGLSSDEIAHTLELVRIGLRNRPSDDRPPFILHVPPPKERATAFRETNLDSEKDELEKSVLWRAVQATLSAVVSVQRSSFQTDIEDMRFGLLIENYVPGNRSAAAASWAFRALHRTVHLHPVVVVEAQLRTLVGAKVRIVPWLRLDQRMLTGDVDTWVDVVHDASFPAYAKYITREYEKQMRAARGRRAVQRSRRRHKLNNSAP